MKRSKLPQELAKNASKLHKHIGILLTELYPNYEVRQEYPVSKVNVGYKSNREKFDWVVLGLKIVIEIHGEQHYGHVCFGGEVLEQAKRNFRKRQEVDWKKYKAAQKAGWAYLVIKYDEKKITAEELSSKISQAVEDSQPSEDIKPIKPKAKIQNKDFQKKEGGYEWSTRKIQSRKFKQ